MKRLAMISIVSLFIASLASCGGGGGGGTNSENSVCKDFCSFGCSKAVTCGLMGAMTQADCVDSCVDEVSLQGYSTEDCVNAHDTVNQMNCEQFELYVAELLTLPAMDEIRLSESADAETIGMMCARAAGDH